MLEEEKSKMVRQKEEENYLEWKAKEDDFDLTQEKLRSTIRMEEGRERPIDFISRIIQIFKKTLPIPQDLYKAEFREVYRVLEDLDYEQLQSIKSDLKLHQNFTQSHQFSQYWNSLQTLADFYIELIQNNQYDNQSHKSKQSSDQFLFYKAGIHQVYTFISAFLYLCFFFNLRILWAYFIEYRSGCGEHYSE